ncbi:MAG: hypothetical protein QXJ28_03200 [Candidatus Pacearchaeota archaeon]
MNHQINSKRRNISFILVHVLLIIFNVYLTESAVINGGSFLSYKDPSYALACIDGEPDLIFFESNSQLIRLDSPIYQYCLNSPRINLLIRSFPNYNLTAASFPGNLPSHVRSSPFFCLMPDFCGCIKNCFSQDFLDQDEEDNCVSNCYRNDRENCNPLFGGRPGPGIALRATSDSNGEKICNINSKFSKYYPKDISKFVGIDGFAICGECRNDEDCFNKWTFDGIYDFVNRGGKYECLDNGYCHYYIEYGLDRDPILFSPSSNGEESSNSKILMTGVVGFILPTNRVISSNSEVSNDFSNSPIPITEKEEIKLEYKGKTYVFEFKINTIILKNSASLTEGDKKAITEKMSWAMGLCNSGLASFFTLGTNDELVFDTLRDDLISKASERTENFIVTVIMTEDDPMTRKMYSLLTDGLKLNIDFLPLCFNYGDNKYLCIANNVDTSSKNDLSKVKEVIAKMYILKENSVAAFYKAKEILPFYRLNNDKLLKEYNSIRVIR